MRHLIAALALPLLAACNRAADGRTQTSAPPRDSAAPVASTSAGALDMSADSLVQRADLNRVMGNGAAKVWMIVVSDFQCPYCREFHEQHGATLRREYVQTGKARIAYLNFPLRQHAHAWPAAERAMCAAAQGKFWPVHDGMFATQGRWESMDSTSAVAVFDSITAAAGVDRAQLKACVDSGRMRPLIQADYDRSMKAGVNSTPTIIIGRNLLAGVQPIENYRRALDAAIAAAAAPKPGS